MQTPRRLAGLLILVMLVAACGTAATSSEPPTTVDPNTPVGTDVPPGGGGDLPGNGGGLIVPKPGQLDVHALAMDQLSATVDGRNVVVTATWTSGVEPCYTLDSILVETGDKSFTITIREGHGPDDVACIEIAQIKQTAIDLGELEPGTYTISDSEGGAAPIEVVID